MSRSAADATRFTATSPHAYSKPPTRSSNPPIPPQQRPPSFSSSPTMKNNFKPSSPSSRSGRSGPSGPAETPLEKVARLRAARFAARDAQVTMWDRVVVRGRVWADVAHRITVLGLMASTVLIGGFSIFAFSDMIIHNRRKRALYYAEQTALLHAQLAAAIAAQKAEEPLSEGQVLLLNRKRARVEGEERVKREKGRWWRWMIRGLEADETAEGEGGGEGREEQGRGGVVSAVEGGPREAFGKAEASTREAFTATESKAGSVLQALEDKRREGERPIEEAGGHGGQLDQLATEAGRAKGEWTSWMTRK